MYFFLGGMETTKLNKLKKKLKNLTLSNEH